MANLGRRDWKYLCVTVSRLGIICSSDYPAVFVLTVVRSPTIRPVTDHVTFAKTIQTATLTVNVTKTESVNATKAKDGFILEHIAK